MKKYIETGAKLKNGKIITIRQAEVSDTENFLNCIKEYIPQSDYIPQFEQEINLNIKEKEELIKSFLEKGNSLLLIAEYENQIIGNIDLAGSSRKAMEHTAMIGMGMNKEWRNTGLGTALLAAIIDWAKANPILETIWLQVYTENTLGLSLYKKMGFEENGIIKDFFKHDDKYFDNLTMTLKVKE